MYIHTHTHCRFTITFTGIWFFFVSMICMLILHKQSKSSRDPYHTREKIKSQQVFTLRWFTTSTHLDRAVQNNICTVDDNFSPCLFFYSTFLTFSIFTLLCFVSLTQSYTCSRFFYVIEQNCNCLIDGGHSNQMGSLVRHWWQQVNDSQFL